MQTVILVLSFIMGIEICARLDDKFRYDAPLFASYSHSCLMAIDEDGIRHNTPNSRFEKWRINQFCFRGNEFEPKKESGIKRIVCMGASETFGLFEDEGKEWPAQLNKLLSQDGFEVVNVAVPGLDLEKYVSYLDKYVLKFQPDKVILYINPYLFLSKQILNYSGQNETKKAQRSPSSAPGDQVSTFSKSAREAFTLRARLKFKLVFKGLFPQELVKKYEIWSGYRQLKKAEGKYLGGRRPLDDVPEEAIAEFERLITKISTFLQNQSIQVVLSTYPVLISHENINNHLDLFLSNRKFAPALSFEGMIAAPSKINDSLRRVAAEMNLDLVDNAHLVPQDTAYFADNVHYSNEGASVIAMNFRAHLLNDAVRGHEQH